MKNIINLASRKRTNGLFSFKYCSILTLLLKKQTNERPELQGCRALAKQSALVTYQAAQNLVKSASDGNLGTFLAWISWGKVAY
jgi:hypothetical protein